MGSSVDSSACQELKQHAKLQRVTVVTVLYTLQISQHHEFFTSAVSVCYFNANISIQTQHALTSFAAQRACGVWRFGWRGTTRGLAVEHCGHDVDLPSSQNLNIAEPFCTPVPVFKRWKAQTRIDPDSRLSLEPAWRKSLNSCLPYDNYICILIKSFWTTTGPHTCFLTWLLCYVHTRCE